MIVATVDTAMWIPILSALVVLQTPLSIGTSDSVPAAPDSALDSATIARAYLDPGARALVAGARRSRAAANRSIRSYRVRVRDRVSVALRALRFERLLYRRETASRIRWRRDGHIRIRALGARETAPIVDGGVDIPDDLDSELPSLAFDPADDRLLIGLRYNENVRHPLAPGSEADYRFQSGDTTTLRLPDGRTIRLVELRVILSARRST